MMREKRGASVLRPYQLETRARVYAAWQEGRNNVLLVLPTGAGKTFTFSDIISNNPGAVCAIAHRQELVGQISKSLAIFGVDHRIIAPKAVVRSCVKTHMTATGRSHYSPNAPVAVAGVDTLINRKDSLRAWAQTVTLWVQDEAHHVLRGNKWGTAALMFPNAKGLGVTATPLRADGCGLGQDYDGLFNAMVEGPNMRNLIEMGFLTDYRIFAPRTEIELGDSDLSKTTGDYSRNKLIKATRRSTIVGDVVDHYLRIARGKLGVTFATDVETATDIASRFSDAGVPAAVVSAKSTDAERASAIEKFARRELLQLVNVDLFGEGFDLPAIEVVSMARKTESYGLYVQQFGRGLRITEGKTEAIIIDHVGNVVRHGLPDRQREWSLARRDRRSKLKRDPDEIPVRACPECTQVYERVLPECPYCGHHPQPACRKGPEYVEGDLCELDPTVLAQMRGEVAKIDRDKEVVRQEMVAKHAPIVGQHTAVKRHVDDQAAQAVLRSEIAQWAGHQRHLGRADSESYRRFYYLFGTDVLSAQALKCRDATELSSIINKENNILQEAICS